MNTRGAWHRRRGAFTLVELLVVIGIIAVLVGVLMPALAGARARAKAVRCMSNLHQIGLGLVMYTNENRGCIVPSYNVMPAPGSTTNYTGGPSQQFDGWACILDRDRLVPSPEQNTNTTFYCPETVDVEGVKDGQTGSDVAKPRGWTDWPLQFTTTGGDSSPKVAVTIPQRGFKKIIRVSYWINGYNPIGSPVADIPSNDLFYTGSVGYGPDNKGNYIGVHRMSGIRGPSQMIVLADGVYMGRQGVTRLGDVNSRIGYRHPGMGRRDGGANIAFADGHVETIEGNHFPRSGQRAENIAGPTIYADVTKIP